MKLRPLAAIACLALALTSLAATGPQAGAAPAPNANYHAVKACDPSLAKADEATCFALRLVDGSGAPVKPMASTGAMTPSDIRSAYNLNGTASGGRTVAIVDAYGYPKAEADLAVYRSANGLSPCTVAGGCLTIINQAGSDQAPPAYNYGWATEQALDLDAVSATCPDCKLLLVQASSASFSDLGTAVNTAASRSGVVAISNSYGGGDAPDATYGAPYNHPGIAVTASTGDSGFKGASFPASSRYVTAVGGTTLTRGGGTRGWTETVWSGAGSGCSAYNAAPTGQTKAMTGCTRRAMADVAAVADPNTGLTVYAPTQSGGSAFQQYGGTSLSAPIIAAVYALSRNTGSTTNYANGIPYLHTLSLYDVTSGSNGNCRRQPMCTARSGWDGPTGLGTPNGIGAF